jgi:hypothetical protein
MYSLGTLIFIKSALSEQKSGIFNEKSGDFLDLAGPKSGGCQQS